MRPGTVFRRARGVAVAGLLGALVAGPAPATAQQQRPAPTTRTQQYQEPERKPALPGGARRGTRRGLSTTFLKRIELMRADTFTRDPLPAAIALRNLSRYDAIWGGQIITSYNPAAWALLRQVRPDILALCYKSADTVREAEVWHNSYMRMGGIQERWFVRRDPGRPDYGKANRARWAQDDPAHPDYRRYWLDVRNPDVQKWAAEEIAAWVSGSCENLRFAYSGLAADNVQIGHRFASWIRAKQPGWDMPGWDEGFCDYLKRIRDRLAPRLLVANTTIDYNTGRDDHIWPRLLASVDGLMVEQRLPRGGKEWRTAIQHHQRVLAAGLIDWWACYPRDYEEFLFDYCSWLLTFQPGQSLFFATRGDPAWANPEPGWYAVYELDPGRPRGIARPLQGCMVREFANAWIVVNPSDEHALVTLDGSPAYVPAHQARVILRRAPGVRTAP